MTRPRCEECGLPMIRTGYGFECQDFRCGYEIEVKKSSFSKSDEDIFKMRKKAHMALDRLWKQGFMSRPEAYAWLANKLNNGAEVHISTMNSKDCMDVVNICSGYKGENNE